MSGAAGVLAVVFLEWTVGWIAAAAWAQSWSVVRRGHFRIVAWGAMALSLVTVVANRGAVGDAVGAGLQPLLVGALAVGSVVYLLVQYSRTDVPGTVVGVVTGALGTAALVVTGPLLSGWPAPLASLQLLAGAALLGAVTNGMLLGHWYLNQPGLKPWALDRLTTLTLAAVVGAAALGVAAAPRLAAAETSGAVLGLPGFGESFGMAFFTVWLVLIAFTGAIVVMARRCVRIRSIQSATGLLYVALLTVGVAEFLVRYLMVNA